MTNKILYDLLDVAMTGLCYAQNAAIYEDGTYKPGYPARDAKRMEGTIRAAEQFLKESKT